MVLYLESKMLFLELLFERAVVKSGFLHELPALVKYLVLAEKILISDAPKLLRLCLFVIVDGHRCIKCFVCWKRTLHWPPTMDLIALPTARK